MARAKEEERPRSIRIPCSEETFQMAHALAGKVPLAVYLRDLIEREAFAKGLKRKGKAQ